MHISQSEAQRLGLVRGHKYRAESITVDGIMLDSKLEAKRYGELLIMQKAGEISDLKVHPEFSLFVTNNCRDWKGIGKYEADFSYYPNRFKLKYSDEFIVEDCKGMITELAKWKIKHFEAQHGIKVKIISSPRNKRSVRRRQQR